LVHSFYYLFGAGPGPWLNDRPVGRRPWVHQKEWRVVDDLLARVLPDPFKGRKLPEEFGAAMAQDATDKISAKAAKEKAKAKAKAAARETTRHTKQRAAEAAAARAAMQAALPALEVKKEAAAKKEEEEEVLAAARAEEADKACAGDYVFEDDEDEDDNDDDDDNDREVFHDARCDAWCPSPAASSPPHSPARTSGRCGMAKSSSIGELQYGF